MIKEYECKKCKTVIERIELSKNEPPMEKCTKCGGELTPVIFSVSSFQLKGKGWYKTDYK